ncbi:hypothetical protein L9F63_020232 [Diploptera punctata]|uniref:F-box domain-containing protein n=1 Tax=Diploptera punctata TaxID=6984 RepID=A0AAD8ED55_DIPPU|nr:hypothetical protein L9F63_020232 [Diploptera punctata]
MRVLMDEEVGEGSNLTLTLQPTGIKINKSMRTANGMHKRWEWFLSCYVVMRMPDERTHLETCPAPRVCHYVPFHVPNPRAQQWMKVPHRTRRILRNSLTKCFPAVPLQPGISSEEESPAFVPVVMTDDEDSADGDENMWECKKAPPGLESSVCSELYKSSREPNAEAHMQINVKPRIVNGSIKKMDEVYSQTNKVILNNSQYYQLAQDPEKSSTEHYVNNMQVDDIFSTSVMDCSSSIIPPPPSSPPMIVSLGLNLTLESITRYQTKPKNMYTFLCAQEFRRDEYSWHYKNVHSDIHGGLNGWLEHRCPLAHYGCMYSLRRFYPITKGATVIHNDTLESFGVKPYVPFDINSTHVNNLLPLCELPFEVLRHICRFLDSFSLCNLALTCRRLREVCCSLLEERGLVVQQWRRCLVGSTVSWSIAHKRWFFSTAFTPVREWGFEAGEHMSNHLKSCICFERNMDSKPYFHIFGNEPDPSLHAKLTGSSRDA